MASLSSCERCDGWVPSLQTRCPHCDAPSAGMARKLLNVCGGGAIALTLMACYGGPPKQSFCDEVDAEQDPSAQDERSLEARPEASDELEPCGSDRAVQRGG